MTPFASAMQISVRRSSRASARRERTSVFGLARGQAVVDEPRHRHRDGEGEDDAQRELEVQAAARGHFAFPSAMTAFAAASTSGRRRLTATP